MQNCLNKMANKDFEVRNLLVDYKATDAKAKRVC